MITISIDSELDRMKEALALFSERNQKFIVMNTLNNAAFQALKDLRRDTPLYIERPIPFTVNSSRVNKATQANLEASVDYKSGLGYNPGSSAGDYLKPVTYSGGRRHKRFEGALTRAGILPPGQYAVPTSSAPRNQYGNVPGSYYTQMLSYLRANPDALSNRRLAKYKKQSTSKFIKAFAKTALNKEKVAKQEARKRERAARFVVFIQGRNGWTAASGIYERLTTLGGRRNASLKLVFAFVSSVQYKKTFPFYEITSSAAKVAFPEAFRQAVNRELMGLARRAAKKSR